MEIRKFLSYIAIALLLSPTPALSQVGIGRVEGEVITTRGITEGTGQIFYVDDSGSDEGAADGSTRQPFATLDFAVGRCGTSPAAASTGCTIYAMEGHAETFSADNSLVIDVAGIRVLGLGAGDLRPQITLATSTAAQVGIAAANIEFANFRIIGNVASTVAYLTISAAGDGSWVHDNIFEEGSASSLLFIDVEGVASNITIENNRFYAEQGAGTNNAAIDIGAAALRVTIRNNAIFGEYDDGSILNSTGAALDMEITDNYIQNEVAAAEAIDLDGASTGIISNNILVTDDFDTALDPGSMGTSGNVWLSTVVDGSDSVPISGALGTTVLSPIRFGGDTYWVNSTGGSDATGSGRSADNPFATLDFAFTATSGVSANNGDVIYLMENHAETLNAAGGNDIDVDIAGVSVVGLGTGANRPTFTLATQAAAELAVEAADFYLENVVFVADVESTAIVAMTAAADGMHFKNVEFREGSATPVLMIDMVGQADDVIIEDSTFLCPTATNCDAAIDLSALTPARTTIRNNFIRGDWDLGGIYSTGAATNTNIHDNTATNLLTNVGAIVFTAAALGNLTNNVLFTDTFGTALDPGSLRTSGNTWSGGINRNAQPIPTYGTFVPGYGYPAVKTGISLAASDNLFNVTGTVVITLMYGHITTVFSGATTDLQIKTDGGSAITADTVVDSYVDESLFTISGDPSIDINGGAGSGVVEVGSFANSEPRNPIIIGKDADPVVIISEPGSADTGVYDMYVWWIPMTVGATLVAD